jgi:hypothetical protein
MAFARDVYTATAAQTDFTISFPYLDNVDVLVYANGTLQTEGTDYNIVSTTICRFVSGRTSGDTIVLQRSTSQTSRLVDYATASTLTEEDLDNDSIQAFYMAQESIDIANTALVLDGSDEWDFQSKQSTNVPSPTSGDSVVNKTYADALVVAAGNVPAPDNPGEDNYFLKASAGTWDWFDLFGTANTFSAAQTFSAKPVINADLDLNDTDAGAAVGPILTLYRNSASPLAADRLAQIKWDGEDSADTKTSYAAIEAEILDPTDASEDGEMILRTMAAGTLADRVHVATGLYMSGATGGDKGADTVNASAVYDDGVQILTGEWEYIGEYTASAAAQLDIEDTAIFGAGYTRVKFVIESLTTDTDDVEVRCRVGTGAGPTYGSASYQWAQTRQVTGAVFDSANASAGTYIPISVDAAAATNALGSAATEWLAGTLIATDLDSATRTALWETSTVYISASAKLCRQNGAATYGGSAAALTGLRFYLQSGNITATIKAYGSRT